MRQSGLSPSITQSVVFLKRPCMTYLSILRGGRSIAQCSFLASLLFHDVFQEAAYDPVTPESFID